MKTGVSFGRMTVDVLQTEIYFTKVNLSVNLKINSAVKEL